MIDVASKHSQRSLFVLVWVFFEAIQRGRTCMCLSRERLYTPFENGLPEEVGFHNADGVRKTRGVYIKIRDAMFCLPSKVR